MQQSFQRQQQSLPEARLVSDGIWKITVPIPFPLRTVNMHALVADNGDWTIVDTGMGTPEARASFTDGLQTAGLRLEQLRAIVLTHHHPDHVGFSGELYEKTGAAVYMHPIDAEAIQIIWQGTMPQRYGRVSRFLLQHGLPQSELWYNQVEPGTMRKLINVPPHDAITPVEDGDYLDLSCERYRVIWTPGHADGQICLYRERDGVFLSADHVLPRITPNIGLYSPYDRPNPLQDYIDSLRKVAPLPATIVLPGHGEPFPDLAVRVREIIEHHVQREQQLVDLIGDQPQHAYELTGKLFGDRLKSNEARRMAVAEVLAHLEYMRIKGRVEQIHTSDGFILYAVA
jgi:glyoxylase-like metal-dependent hydrolase (beta-lactamase superfamily II)